MSPQNNHRPWGNFSGKTPRGRRRRKGEVREESRHSPEVCEEYLCLMWRPTGYSPSLCDDGGLPRRGEVAEFGSGNLYL